MNVKALFVLGALLLVAGCTSPTAPKSLAKISAKKSLDEGCLASRSGYWVRGGSASDSTWVNCGDQ